MGQFSLIVDSDGDLLESMAEYFVRRGFDVAATGCYQAAMEAAGVQPFNAAIIDLSLDARVGLRVIKQIHTAACTTTVIALSGHDEVRFEREAFENGASEYFRKPCSLAALAQRIASEFDIACHS